MSDKIAVLAKHKDLRKKQQYNSLVMDAWDRFERVEKRGAADKRSEVERAARRKL